MSLTNGMKRAVVLAAMATTALLASAAYAQHSKSAISEGHMVPRTKTAVTVDTCPPANCQEVEVAIPLTATVVKVICQANMNWGTDNDLPRETYKEVPCGSDGGTASFSKPEIVKTSTNIFVKVMFRNRSNLHDRDAKLGVTYTDPYL